MKETRYIILSIFLLFCFVAVPAWLIISDREPVEQTPAQSAQKRTKSDSRLRHEITGVSYSTTLDGNSLFRLTADSITLRKKRIGFLRFNLFTEALIRNGVFQIYEPAPLPNNTPETDSLDIRGRKKSQNKLISQEIRNSLLPPLPVKRIISIASRPATLIIHHNDATETRISSSKAIISREKNELIFSGRAKAVSGNKSISADQLHVSLKGRTITARNNVVLTTPQGSRYLQQVKTDLLLNTGNGGQ